MPTAQSQARSYRSLVERDWQVCSHILCWVYCATAGLDAEDIREGWSIVACAFPNSVAVPQPIKSFESPSLGTLKFEPYGLNRKPQ